MNSIRSLTKIFLLIYLIMISQIRQWAQTLQQSYTYTTKAWENIYINNIISKFFNGYSCNSELVFFLTERI